MEKSLWVLETLLGCIWSDHFGYLDAYHVFVSGLVHLNIFVKCSIYILSIKTLRQAFDLFVYDVCCEIS